MLACVVVVTLLGSARASAQSEDVAAAAELFRQGRAAMEAKNFDVACPKLEESLRMDPHVGTEISVAECEEATHALATARAHWQHAADRARALGDARAAVAEERLAAIDPRVPRLTLRLPDGAGKDVVVKRDGVVLGAASLGVPLPVDVGSHVIEVTSPTRQAVGVTVDLEEGEKREVLLRLGPELPPVTSVVENPAPGASTAAEPSQTKPPPSPLGYLSGGLGVGGVTVGAIFGVLALGDYKDADNLCPQHQGCSDAAMTARSHADSGAWVANVGIAVGVVGIAVGAYYLFLAPRGAPSEKVHALARGVLVTF